MTALFNTNCRFDRDRHDKIIHSIKAKGRSRLESSAMLVLCLNQGRTKLLPLWKTGTLHLEHQDVIYEVPVVILNQK